VVGAAYKGWGGGSDSAAQAVCMLYGVCAASRAACVCTPVHASGGSPQHPSTHVSLRSDMAAAMASARSPPGVPSMGFWPRASTHSNDWRLTSTMGKGPGWFS
jgi:hypothetical protein